MVHAGRDVDIADRAVAAVPYLVPLFDGLKYGAMLLYELVSIQCSGCLMSGPWQLHSRPACLCVRAQGGSSLHSSQRSHGCWHRSTRSSACTSPSPLPGAHSGPLHLVPACRGGCKFRCCTVPDLHQCHHVHEVVLLGPAYAACSPACAHSLLLGL